MADPETWLLSSRLRAVAARLAAVPDGPEADALWKEAEAAVAAADAGEDEVVALPVLLRDRAELAALIAGWDSGKVPLPPWDKATLKRAMNAFKRRLKLTRTDDDISSSRNPLSRGASSSITGVAPPDQYPPDVWELLVRQGRLRDAGHGILETVSGGPAE